MGTKLGPILKTHEVTISELSGKKFAVDSFNMLYQFLTTIRQQDGRLLTNSQGKVTSHLSGLFFRVTNLMKHNLKLAFVFDGIPPDLKKEERKRRTDLKKEAERKYQEAVDEGDIELMRKYAGRTAKLTPEMVNEAKELITALGLPIIQAPSEGEAQAAHMVEKGDCYALISQDTDGLVFGSEKTVKNLSVSRRKKVTGTSTYQTINPEVISLSENLKELGINHDQLIVLAILSGTDFNIGGVNGIGPKKALKLIEKHKNFDELFKEVNWEFGFSWKTVFDIIKNMPITEEYKLEWNKVDNKKVIKIMVEDNEFSRERVEKVIEDISKKQSQKGLDDFF